MKKKIGRVLIRLDNSIEEPEYEFNIPEDIEPTKYFYSLFIDCSSNNTYQELISDKKSINEAIKGFNEEEFDEFGYESDNYDEEEYNERLDSFESVRKNNKITHSKIKNSNYKIELQGKPDDIIDFINRSEGINSKNIILTKEGYPFSIKDRDTLKYISENINNLENICISADGNTNEVSIKSYIDTIDYIDDIVNSIKKYDLSPLEQVMFAYDIVRDRKYKEETKKQDVRESRDLTSVLLGDRIVCAGFAEIFDKVCKKLGLNSYIQHLRPYDITILRGHARNSVHIKDEKYDIDGIYFFDTTWDSKRNKTNRHFDSYMFFGMTINDMFKLESIQKVPMKSDFNDLAKLSKVFFRTPEQVNSDHLLEINRFSRKFLDEELFSVVEMCFYDKYNKEEKKRIIDKSKEFISLFTQDISRIDFIRLLSNVRAVEYYEFPDKFPYSTKKIAEIVKKSGRDNTTPEEKLLACFFGEGAVTPKYIMKEEEIDKKIEGVHLAKALRLTLEKKQNEEDTQ